MKNKGIILGAIWGLVGIIKFSPSNNPFVWIFGGPNATTSKILTEIIGIPITISSKILLSLFPILEEGGGPSLAFIPVMIFLSILIGALIGFTIEKVLKEIKEKI